MAELTQERVRELFEYQSDTGYLVNKTTRNASTKGMAVGASSKSSVKMGVDGRYYRRSKLVWLYHTGVIPRIVLHRNGNKTDDRIENLKLPGPTGGADTTGRNDGAITGDRLRELLAYDQSSGIFTWKVANKTRSVGDEAGAVHRTGYVNITVDRVTFSAHRLAWFYVTGCWPDSQIDHVDGNRSNNAFANLRIASSAQNAWNAKRRPGVSGVKGVSIKKKNGTVRWAVSVRQNGKTHYFGSYASIEEAARVRKLAADKLHGEFARHE